MYYKKCNYNLCNYIFCNIFVFKIAYYGNAICIRKNSHR